MSKDCALEIRLVVNKKCDGQIKAEYWQAVLT